MKTAGWIVTCLGFAAALLWNALGQDDVGIMAVAALSIIAGMVLLAVNAMMRMSRGELRLRPFDALKRMPLLFLIMVAIYALVDFLLPARQTDWTETLIRCTAVSLTMALYFSAYRKPA